MTILTSLRKFDTLTETELKHCIQRVDVEIEWYKRVIENYPSDRLEKCGMPYLKNLYERKQIFVNQIIEIIRVKDYTFYVQSFETALDAYDKDETFMIEIQKHEFFK